MPRDSPKRPARATRIDVDSLTEAEVEAVLRLVSALRRPISKKINPRSDIVTMEFDEALSVRLLVYHGLHDPGQVLTKKDFEFAFKEAREWKSTRVVTLTDDPTYRGADAVEQEGRRIVRWSLKTEGAKGINRSRILISKLMESIWTKDLTQPIQFLQGLPNVTKHFDGYDRVLVLRAFGRLSNAESVRYELWEIPKPLLQAMEGARLADCSPVSRAGSCTLSVKSQGIVAYQIFFDGSDQKIQVRNLQTAMCVHHGTWELSTTT